MQKRVIVFSIISLLFLLTTNLVAKNETTALKDVFKKAKTLPMENNISKEKKLTISQATIEAINSVRAKDQICSKSVKPLRWNQTLYQRAKEHSIDMAVTGMLQHNGSGTKTDITAKTLGLKRGSYFYERVNQKVNGKTLYSGELIIRTSKETLQTPKEVIEYWIKRPSDCKVIMDPNFSDVALAKVISNKDNKAYWTLLLAGAKKRK